MKIGVFLPNWIGDAVMATPALRALRNHFPNATIVGIHRPVISDVLAGTDLLDEHLIHHPEGNDPGQRGLAFVRNLRKSKFDLLLLFTNSFRTGWVAWLSGAQRRMGYRREGRGWMLTDPVDEPQGIVSAFDNYQDLVSRLGCSIESKQTQLGVLPEDETAWSRFAESLPSDIAGLPTVIFNSGGAFGAAKHWPTEYFGELARKIVDSYDKKVVVLCGPDEREAAREIVRLADRPRVTSLADCDISIGLSKVAVKRAELMVTTDSGPRHFAQAFDVPVVTLYGPTHIGLSETYYDRAVALQMPVDCGPCQQRICPLGHHQCMRDLTVDQVFRAVREQFEQISRRAA